MARLFAFLRAINVGGHTVTMDKLRRIFEELGLEDVETFIASGNVLFNSPRTSLSALERKIAARLEESLGYEVVTFIRTAPEVVAIAAHKPFPEAQIRGAGAFCIGFLGQPLDTAGKKSLAGLTSEIDHFKTHGREVYWLCDTRQSESRFSNTVFEKVTGARVTFRGANTVAKLAAKAGLTLRRPRSIL
jgi:uncharacterized protein (DUF1697 family)